MLIRREAATISTADQRPDNERGAVLFLMFLFLAIFLGVAALAVDLAAIATRGQALQNTADAAALAGVVEYEEQLVAGASEADARAAAAGVIDEIIEQNGIDPNSGSINVTIEYPAGGGRVTVTIQDEDPPSYLGGTVIPGFDSSVDRVATAEFLGCDACSITVDIPKPFSSVKAEGRGDGYKPVSVRNRLYAINHNTGEQQIVCVDRRTQLPCWVDGAGDPAVSRNAYASGMYDDRNPEMPHTAVVDNRIFWSASDSSGHRLFCFQTAPNAQDDAPCTSSWQLGSDRRVDEDETSLITSDKDENRGSGTVAVGGKVFVFTDNHEIHCFDPAFNDYCTAFEGAGSEFRPFGGRPTGLDVFPDADPFDGNHGSSIDRVVDETTGYIYSTLHIPYVVDSLKCSATYAITETNVEDLIDEIVVLREPGGKYLNAAGTDSVTLAGLTGDFAETRVRWRVTRDAGDTAVYLEAVGLASGSTQEWLDGQADLATLPSPLGTDFNRAEVDNQWNLVHDGVGFTIENFALPSFVNVTPFDTVVQEELSTTRWEISRCVNPALDAGYAAGTWLHCYDSGVVSGVPAPCPGFAPSAIHEDASRFSGRLFFYYDSAEDPTALGVCSTGYQTPRALGPAIVEITCVDLDDGDPNTQGATMSTLANEINVFTGTNPGAWGDPHYNAFQNRLFYPTEHNTSRIVCWDFDSSATCGSITGETPPGPGGSIETEDYGFVSDDNCVFALGHNAYFWAFQASDLGEPCVGAKSSTPIQRCPCTGGASRWGVLDFSDLDITGFDVFNIQITSDPADIDQPGVPYTTVRELKDPNVARIINLDDEVGIPDDALSVRVVIYVEAETDPFEFTNPTFEVRFLQRPRLVE